MLAKTYSATVLGVEAHPIEVEVDQAVGLSQFTIVGLPDGTIKESKERVIAAIGNSGFNFPIRRITCNNQVDLHIKQQSNELTFYGIRIRKRMIY